MSHLATHTSTPDWQLRVTDRNGTSLCGAAVLVAPLYAVTCAHVVRKAATGSGDESDCGPGSTVRLDAPRGGARWEAVATVVEDGWWWKTRAPWDVAVLRLDRPAPAHPATFARRRVGDRVRVLGFPRSEAGRWVTGRVAGDGGSHFGYVQIDIDSAAGLTVLPGFSGSGVREEKDDALLGIVCEAAGNGRAGWMIPMEAVPRVWPGGEVDGWPAEREEAPTRTDRDGGTRAIADTARAMTDLHVLLSPDLRLTFYRSLDKRLRRRLRADQDLESFAGLLILLAYKEYGILRQTLELLAQLEDGSAAMREVWDAAAPLLEREPR